MSARWGHPEDDFGDEDVDDPEAPQECDLGGEDDLETDTEPCPACGREIAEMAEQCPYCGQWVTLPAPASSRRTIGFIAVVILLIVLLLVWLF